MPQNTATFGGGCFWCTEAVFEVVRGVSAVTSGYAGGHVANPTYEQVCAKKTGHAEVVRVEFDPAVIPYRDLVELFLVTHDPTTLNRQGNDVGPQYRSVIYTHDEGQRGDATGVIEALNSAKVFPGPIVTEVAPLTDFYAAEDYHQGYFRSNPSQPYCAFLISPKLAKLRKQFAGKLKG